MNKIKDINVGDFLSFKTSDKFYSVIFCSNTQKSRSPHFFNFAVTTIRSKEEPTIKEVRNSNFYGTGNRKTYQFSEDELKKIWKTHPEIKPYFLGAYELLVMRKDFMTFRNRFKLIESLSILKNLNMNSSGSMNASSIDVLDNLFKIS